jgi:hypothetical protein
VTMPNQSRPAAPRIRAGKQGDAAHGNSMPGYQPVWAVYAFGSAADVSYIKESKRYLRLVRCGFRPSDP